MKKLFVLLLTVTMFCSCGTLLYQDYHRITDYNEQIELLKIHFPEIYDLYRNGDVVLSEMFEYTDRKTSKKRVHISYHYR